MKANQRKFNQVPLVILSGFLMMFFIQILYHHVTRASLTASFSQLDRPAPVSVYRTLSQGSEKIWSYLLLLAVQLHDNQKGLHVSYKRIDYDHLIEWLLTLYELNPQSDYPAFLASRVYSQVKDPQKIRLLINFIDKLFERNPEQHWRRMTEACLLAKHQLQDLPLALELAEKVAALPATVEMPFWARDMKLVLLDELNQYESAQLLISSLLQSNTIKDPDEILFLQSRLLKIQQSLSSSKQNLKQDKK